MTGKKAQRAQWNAGKKERGIQTEDRAFFTSGFASTNLNPTKRGWGGERRRGRAEASALHAHPLVIVCGAGLRGNPKENGRTDAGFGGAHGEYCGSRFVFGSGRAKVRPVHGKGAWPRSWGCEAGGGAARSAGGVEQDVACCDERNAAASIESGRGVHARHDHASRAGSGDDGAD